MKLLFLTRFDFIESKSDGGAVCAFRNYSMLSNIYGKDNVLLCILTSDSKSDREDVKYFKIEKNIFKIYFTYICLDEQYSKKQKREIINYICTQKIDKIFFDGSTFGQIIKNNLIRKMDNVVFFHNVERQYTWDQVKKHSIFCIFRYFSARYNERLMCRFGKRFICLNNRDQRLIKKYYNVEVDMVLPITLEDSFRGGDNDYSDDYRSQVQLLYVGSYLAHNYTGLIWFIEKVMPYVDAKLTIIGKNMEKLNSKISHTDNVCILGTVKELEQYYVKADAVVMPVFMGGGMKVKTAEAFMYGKNIFASKEALEGYAVDGVEGIFQCDSQEEFIKKINDYARNCSQKTKRINENVRKLFLDKYCTQIYLKQFQNIVK